MEVDEELESDVGSAAVLALDAASDVVQALVSVLVVLDAVEGPDELSEDVAPDGVVLVDY